MAMTEQERIEAICSINVELSEWVKLQIEDGYSYSEIIAVLKYAIRTCERT